MGELTNLLVGVGAGGGGVGLFIVLFRLLFARERSEYTRLENRIVTVERDLKEERDARLECIRNLGITEGRIRQMSEDFDKVIRRHDDKTNEQIQLQIKDMETMHAREIDSLKRQLEEALQPGEPIKSLESTQGVIPQAVDVKEP
jgi:DNA anti-recombination protein RmuC